MKFNRPGMLEAQLVSSGRSWSGDELINLLLITPAGVSARGFPHSSKTLSVRSPPGRAQISNVRFSLNENQHRPALYLTTQGNVPVWSVGTSIVLEPPRAGRWPRGMSAIRSRFELFRRFLGRVVAQGLPHGIRLTR